MNRTVCVVQGLFACVALVGVAIYIAWALGAAAEWLSRIAEKAFPA